MTSWQGLERDPAEWARLRERHRDQQAALERLLLLLSGIAHDFERLHGDIGSLRRGVLALDRQQAALGKGGGSGREFRPALLP